MVVPNLQSTCTTGTSPDQSFKSNGWKFFKKWSCNSEFHAQAIIMYQSFYFFSGEREILWTVNGVNEIHVKKQKRDDRFVPPWEPLSSQSFTRVSLDPSFPLLPSRNEKTQSPGNK